MKHIRIFEAWGQTELDFSMTPEQFQQAVEDAMATKSPKDALSYLKKVMDQNPHLRKDPMSARALTPLVKSLTSDDHTALKNEFSSAKSSMPISLEDWSALIQGLSGLPKDFAATLGSEVLTRVMKEIPSIKQDPSYMRELTKFSSVIKSSVEL